MDLTVIVNIILSILSFILAGISVVTVVITLKQNNKMIEESTRPYIGIYGQCINLGTPRFYLVVRNFGQSVANISRFEYDYDFTGCYSIDSDKDFLKELTGATLAPGQSRICMFEFDKINSPVKFDYEYISSTGKKYVESQIVDLKAAVHLPNEVVTPNGADTKQIAYALQEMLKKSL